MGGDWVSQALIDYMNGMREALREDQMNTKPRATLLPMTARRGRMCGWSRRVKRFVRLRLPKRS